MGQLVKVSQNAFYTPQFVQSLTRRHQVRIPFNLRLQALISLFNKSDIDECPADTSPCDANADCTNTDGSFSCTCKKGFTGDGVSCQGRGEYRYYAF